MERTATISECGRYRYSLTRRWGEGATCCFVMLNPSTADAEVDDPTIRRCIGFAQREGYGALEVVNLFAYRATDPKRLRNTPDPIGPENNQHLAQAFDKAGLIVAAWGAHGSFHSRNQVVRRMLNGRSMCLGTTAKGEPKHPLYLAKNAPLMPWPK